MSNNRSLQDAKANRKDEFYTQMEDIENELFHYAQHFKDKVVYCNCDTPDSNFVKYFQTYFNVLGLKKLIHTSIQEGVDFRSDESVELLKQADIVVTNPPFSLFRECVAQLVQYDKKFLILGNQNAITYKEVFPLLKENKIWLGVNSGQKSFYIPDDYPLATKSGGIDERGRKYINMGNTVWFTNLEHRHHREELILTETFEGYLS